MVPRRWGLSANLGTTPTPPPPHPPLQHLPCCTPATQLLVLSFPKKSQDLHFTEVYGQVCVAALWPRGTPKPRALASCIHFCLLGQSGLKVQVATTPQDLDPVYCHLATTRFQKLPFSCPRFPGGISGFTKQSIEKRRPKLGRF